MCEPRLASRWGGDSIRGGGLGMGPAGAKSAVRLEAEPGVSGLIGSMVQKPLRKGDGRIVDSDNAVRARSSVG